MDESSGSQPGGALEPRGTEGEARFRPDDERGKWNGGNYTWDGGKMQAQRLPRFSPAWWLGWIKGCNNVSGAVGQHLRLPFTFVGRKLVRMAHTMQRHGVQSAGAGWQLKGPSEMLLKPSKVLCSLVQPGPTDSNSKSGPMSQLVAVYVDSWTLELTPAAAEELYQAECEKRWHTWLSVAKCSSVVACTVALVSVFTAIRTGRDLVACALAVVLAMLFSLLVLKAMPLYRSVLLWPLLASQMVLAVVLTMLPVSFPQLVENMPWVWNNPQDSGPLQAAWLHLLCSLLSKWYLVKEMWLFAGARCCTLLLSSTFAVSRSHLAAGLSSTGSYALMLLLFYCHERSRRHAFLQKLRAPALRPQHFPSPAHSPLPSAALQPTARPQRAADLCAEMNAHYMESSRLFLPNAAAPLTLSAPSTLHFHFPWARPEDMLPAFGNSLVESLRRQGYRMEGSYIMQGSLWLTVAVSSIEAPARPLDLPQLMDGLLTVESNADLLLMEGLLLQWMGKHYHFRQGELEKAEEADGPVVVDLYPRSVKAGAVVQLNLVIKQGNRNATKLSVVLRRSHGGCIVHRVPVPSEAALPGGLMHIVTTVQLDAWSGCGCCWGSEVYLAEVHDGEAFSRPCLLQASHDEEMVAASLQLSARSICNGCDVMMWQRHRMLQFQDRMLSLQAPLWRQLHSSATQPGELQLPPELLQTAELLRGVAPTMLAHALLRGASSLVAETLRGLLPAFLPALASGYRPPAAGAPVLVPGSTFSASGQHHRSRRSAAAHALSDLLQSVAASAPGEATILHLLVLSCSTGTLRVLQAAAEKHGMELNWVASGRSLLPALVGLDVPPPQRDRGVTAMELCIALLPESAEFVELAASKSGAAAGAWLHALRSAAAPLPQEAAWLTPRLEQLAREGSSSRAREAPADVQQGWQLAFQDRRLEEAWLADSMRAMQEAHGLARALALSQIVLSVLLELLYEHRLSSLALSVSATMSGIVLLLLTVQLPSPRWIVARNCVTQFVACACGSIVRLALSRFLKGSVSTCGRVLVVAVYIGIVMPFVIPLPFKYQVWTTAAIASFRGLQRMGGIGCLRSFRPFLAAATLGMLMRWSVERRSRIAWLRLHLSPCSAGGGRGVTTSKCL